MLGFEVPNPFKQLPQAQKCHLEPTAAGRRTQTPPCQIPSLVPFKSTLATVSERQRFCTGFSSVHWYFPASQLLNVLCSKDASAIQQHIISDLYTKTEEATVPVQLNCGRRCGPRVSKGVKIFIQGRQPKLSWKGAWFLKRQKICLKCLKLSIHKPLRSFEKSKQREVTVVLSLSWYLTTTFDLSITRNSHIVSLALKGAFLAWDN